MSSWRGRAAAARPSSNIAIAYGGIFTKILLALYHFDVKIISRQDGQQIIRGNRASYIQPLELRQAFVNFAKRMSSCPWHMHRREPAQRSVRKRGEEQLSRNYVACRAACTHVIIIKRRGMAKAYAALAKRHRGAMCAHRLARGSRATSSAALIIFIIKENQKPSSCERAALASTARPMVERRAANHGSARNNGV